jgi:hypothetical protein
VITYGYDYDTEVAVKVPRFRIAWVMVAVAIAALDFTAIRVCLNAPSRWGEDFLLGVLPMVNVLGVGLLIGQQRPQSRPFFLGFETFGAMALALYVVLTLVFVDPWGASTPYGDLISSYLDPVVSPIEAIIGRDRPFVFIPTICLAIVLMLGWPQVAFALIGGFLSRRYKVIIVRR